ncbi:hypothetical protein [Shewanella sp. GXUN23E]
MDKKNMKKSQLTIKEKRRLKRHKHEDNCVVNVRKKKSGVAD